MHRLLKMALAVGFIWAFAVAGAGAREAAQEGKEASKAPVGHEVEKSAEKGHEAAKASGGHGAEKLAEGEHGGGAPSNPLKPEPTLAIWTLVVFVGLLLILSKFAWKPLMHALHEREKHLEHVLHETERARNESEALLSEHRKQMARAAEEVRIPARAGAGRCAANGRDDRQAGPGRGRGGQAAGPARHRCGPRFSPGRNLGEDGRYGSLGRRAGALERADRRGPQEAA